MTLSRRERYIVLGTALALAALVLDRFILSPLLEGRSQAEARKQALLSDMNRARAALRLGEELKPKWREIVQAGMQADPAAAESQILHAIGDWAEESGVTLSRIKPHRMSEKTPLPQIAFQATGSGSMEAVARLIWRMQNATIPFRITELELAPRKEGADDLSVQLRLSTIYMPGGTQPAARAGATSRATGVSE